jgi:hypothetical protein
LAKIHSAILVESKKARYRAQMPRQTTLCAACSTKSDAWRGALQVAAFIQFLTAYLWEIKPARYRAQMPRQTTLCIQKAAPQ